MSIGDRGRRGRARLARRGFVPTSLALSFAVLVAVPGELPLGAPPAGRGPGPTVLDTSNRAAGAAAAATDDWPTYLGSDLRLSANVVDPSISLQSAHRIAPLWASFLHGPVAASPTVVAGTVYVGSWDGYEYALNATNGAMRWRTFLGVDSTCGYQLGVTSAATVVGHDLYVGGGNGRWFALDARNGSVTWSILVGNISRGYYNWASPLVYRGFAYVGVASDCDKPLVPGALLKVSLRSHAVVGRFNTTMHGDVGASIWSSPAVDPNTGTLFVTTGNPGPNASPYAEAILALNASTFHLIDHWQVPASATAPDGDFGATPALFTDSRGTPLVGALNKNGVLYVWERANLHRGPVWSARPGPGLAPGAVGGGRYFVGTGRADVGGVAYNGTLRAYSAGGGQLGFSIGLPAKVLGAPLWVNGMVVVGSGPQLDLFAANNGTRLARFSCSGGFVGAPVVAEGRLLAGCTDGHLFAFGLPVQATLQATPVRGAAPLKVTLRGSGSAGVPGYQYSWSFGDGSPNATTATTTHTYRQVGTYNATLWVTDAAGHSAYATQVIHVRELMRRAVRPRSIPTARAD